MKTKIIKIKDIVIPDVEEFRNENKFTIPVDVEHIKSVSYIGMAIANENMKDACFIYVETNPSSEHKGYVHYELLSPVFGKFKSIKPIKAEYVDFALDCELEKHNLTCADLKWKVNTELENSRSFNSNNEYVYFLKADRFIKIGKSSGSPHSRINALQTGCPFPITLIAFINGGLEKESELHKRFEKYKVHGEWFLGVGELMEFINSINGAENDE